MIVAERKIRKLERQFLARSQSAFSSAAERARNPGSAVVVSKNGAIYRISPDGKQELLKHLEASTPVQLGRKVRIG